MENCEQRPSTNTGGGNGNGPGNTGGNTSGPNPQAANPDLALQMHQKQISEISILEAEKLQLSVNLVNDLKDLQLSTDKERQKVLLESQVHQLAASKGEKSSINLELKTVES